MMKSPRATKEINQWKWPLVSQFDSVFLGFSRDIRWCIFPKFCLVVIVLREQASKELFTAGAVQI